MSGKTRIGNVFMALGVLLICSALALTGYNYHMDRKADEFADSILDQLPAAAEENDTDLSEYMTGSERQDKINDYVPDMDMPETEIDGRRYIGVLEIPALRLKLQVMSELSYPNLRLSPCRYTGSIYNGDMIIAAHNYNSHFGKLSRLPLDSTVLFTDVDGNRFEYFVKDMETLGGTDIEGMQSGDWDLTLFTCTYGGKSRVTVRCGLVQD